MELRKLTKEEVKKIIKQVDDFNKKKTSLHIYNGLNKNTQISRH